METRPSTRFGGWELRCNGLQQHGLSAKEFIKQAMDEGLCRADAKVQLNRLLESECWYSKDGQYKVVKKYITDGDGACHAEAFNGTCWLSIRMHGDNFYGENYLCDWRDFQAIKNDLCGEHLQGVEIYPQEDVLHDTANVFHLWVFPEGIRLPLGWGVRDVEDGREDQRELGK